MRRDGKHRPPKRKYRGYRSPTKTSQLDRVSDRSAADGATAKSVPAQAVVPHSASIVADWQLDPVVAQQVEETLSCLTLKRRRFLKRFIETGHQRQAVYEAGYHPSSPASATAMAQEILQSPATQHALHALIEARGLSARKLDEIHAIHLGRHSSVDGGDRDRSLKALAMARRYLVRQPVPGAKPLADQLLDQMSVEELDVFAKSGRWPARFQAQVSGEAAIGDERVRHHHGRSEPEPPEDPERLANSHARRPPREPEEPAESGAPAGDGSRPPARPEPPPLAAVAAGTRDYYVGAAAPSGNGADRVYDPASPQAGPVNARLLTTYEDDRRRLAADEQTLRDSQRALADPRLRDLAGRDRGW